MKKGEMLKGALPFYGSMGVSGVCNLTDTDTRTQQISLLHDVVPQVLEVKNVAYDTLEVEAIPKGTLLTLLSIKDDCYVVTIRARAITSEYVDPKLDKYKIGCSRRSSFRKAPTRGERDRTDTYQGHQLQSACCSGTSSTVTE